MYRQRVDKLDQLVAAIDGCDRVLWRRRRTPRERLTALLEAGYDLDTGGSDDMVRMLETRVAGLLGKPAAAFFPTGTMAQQVALRCWAERTGSKTVALHPIAHPEVHERDALTGLTGLRTVHPTVAPRPVTAAEVAALDEPFGTLMLELPLRDAGFLLPTWAELTATVQAGRERDAIVHFDGARIWECTAHLGRGLAEIAALADSVYVSFYKSLGAMSGAALAIFRRDMTDDRLRRRHGGTGTAGRRSASCRSRSTRSPALIPNCPGCRPT